MWDPAQYGRYADHRSRPFFELISRVNAADPRLVYDLGCGPGTMTATLSERWPAAQVVGVDNDPTMLASAAAHVREGRLSFVSGDLTSYLPPVEADVVVSNAAYQWVPNNVEMLGRLAKQLKPGAWIAVQVPGNHNAHSHVIIGELAESSRWRGRLSGAEVQRDVVLTAAGYGEVFVSHGLEIDTWETTYNQVLPGEDPVLEWVKGSTLRPILDHLSATDGEEFLSELGPLLRAAYPRGASGTVFPFRRIFAVAHRV